jgi:hypothetical protein
MQIDEEPFEGLAAERTALRRFAARVLDAL